MLPCGCPWNYHCLIRIVSVKVANEDMLKTQGACHDVNLKIQGQDFQVDLNVLSLGDYDVVLGTQWLYTLGLI